MIAELILGGVLATAGGAAYYLVNDFKRTREQNARAAKAELTAKEQETIRLRGLFRDSIINKIRKSPNDFNLLAFADECDFDRSEAGHVAEEIYAMLAESCFSDGVISEAERKRLDKLGTLLEISSQITTSIEAKAKAERYQTAVADSLKDGRVTAGEANELDELRRSLGLTRRESLEISSSMTAPTYLSLLRKIIKSGTITTSDEQDLRHLKETLADGSIAAYPEVKATSINLFREAFSIVVQDGEITQEEERLLSWLQREFDLSDREISPYLNKLREVKALAKLRRGELPSLSTQKILESGELCHWESGCIHRYETARDRRTVEGSLLLTSNRLVFASSIKGATFSFSHSKIIDLELLPPLVQVQTSISKGTGSYEVAASDKLEATLFALARRQKYLLSEGFSSAKTRHIPDKVKREVWQKDGGQCASCRAMDYLEFDHIIPHSKGGANTVANVQLLCRKCNLNKGDRI